MILSWRTLRKVLIAAASAAYVVLGFVAAISDDPPLIALIVGVVPMFAIALTTAWNSRARVLLVPLCLVLGVVFVLNLEFLRTHVAWLYFVQHAGTMLSLGVMFGATLGSDESALCSRIACFALSSRPDDKYLHYTWKVTLAWTVFFFVSALLSVLLFFFAPLVAWSTFAILLTPILLGIMFVGEYLIRCRAIPDRPHFGIAETIQAYNNYSRR